MQRSKGPPAARGSSSREVSNVGWTIPCCEERENHGIREQRVRLKIFNVLFNEDISVILLPCFSHMPLFSRPGICQLFLAVAGSQELLEGQEHEAPFPPHVPAKVQDHALELPMDMVLLVPARTGLPALQIMQRESKHKMGKLQRHSPNSSKPGKHL